ncbi:MAG TPA: ABC transporter permease [Mycobacteriales bacterium]|nr:ABC transporter permease [Mycobacteriales bacterium]
MTRPADLRPTPLLASLAAVYAGQTARARVVRASLFFVATLQSLGLLVLLRGVVDDDRLPEKQQIVAGAVVLVVAFVALNLLAQRFGRLRADGGLDYYAALPVRPVAVVLGTAASYASFAVPGTVVVALVGVVLYDLPVVHLWLLVPVVALAGAALAGLGALIGLAAPRAEIATMSGQLGMSLVLFLSLVRAERMPVVIRAVRAVLPSTYAADALAQGLAADPSYGRIAADLAVCAVAAVVALTAATAVFRRAVAR